METGTSWFMTKLFLMFFRSCHRKKCRRNRIDHEHPSGTAFTLVSLYSTKITGYGSWFLEYKLTRVNSVLHGRPWWFLFILTHWGRATHICVGKLTIIGPDNGLSLGRRQAIIWTIAGIELIGPLGTNLSEISIGIQTFSFKKMHLKMSSGLSGYGRVLSFKLSIFECSNNHWAMYTMEFVIKSIQMQFALQILLKVYT